MKYYIKQALAVGGGFGFLALAGAAYNKVETREIGYPGVAMQITDSKPRLADRKAANEVPIAIPRAPDGGALAAHEYENVKVLGHLSTAQFTRMMTSITQWVAPEAGCGYCHAPERDANGAIVRNEDGYPQADLDKMWSDEVYSKVVSRRMIQMTQHINEAWPSHVGKTGATCWTCHRGNNVPRYVWFNDAGEREQTNMAAVHYGTKGDQNHPNTSASYASLPGESFEVFLAGDRGIRVQTMQDLPAGNRHSIKSAEWTYGLMMHMSSALGVNCTYCHNSRAFGDWEQSPPARKTAWYGIRMVRDLNNAFLEPLGPTYPDYRRGPAGDAPKANCSTCHQGAYKPLLGESMLADFPSLAKAEAQPEPKPEPEPPPPEPEAEAEDEGAGGGDAADAEDDAEDEAPAPVPAPAPVAPAPAAPKAPAPAAPKAPAPSGP